MKVQTLFSHYSNNYSGCRPIPRTVASVLAEQMSIAVLEREREEAMMRERRGEGDEEDTSGITLAEFMSSYYRYV